MVRVSDKLGAAHPLYVALKALDDDLIFRNSCAHWKEPASPFTTPELREVVKKWRAIVDMVTCVEEKCGEYVCYDRTKNFACGCGKLVVSKGGVTPAAKKQFQKFPLSPEGGAYDFLFPY